MTGSFGAWTGAAKLGDAPLPPQPTTWDSTQNIGPVTLSNGDLTFTTPNNGGGNDGAATRSVAGVTTGKYYWEVTINSASTNPPKRPAIGIVGSGTLRPNVAGVWFGNSRVIIDTNKLWNNVNGTLGFANGGLTTNQVNDTWGVAFDADSRAVWIRRNSTWYNGASDAEITSGNTANAVGLVTSSALYYAAIGNYDPGSSWAMTANFGNSAYVHTPPTGFGPLIS